VPCLLLWCVLNESWRGRLVLSPTETPSHRFIGLFSQFHTISTKVFFTRQQVKNHLRCQVKETKVWNQVCGVIGMYVRAKRVIDFHEYNNNFWNAKSAFPFIWHPCMVHYLHIGAASGSNMQQTIIIYINVTLALTALNANCNNNCENKWPSKICSRAPSARNRRKQYARTWNRYYVRWNTSSKIFKLLGISSNYRILS